MLYPKLCFNGLCYKEVEVYSLLSRAVYNDDGDGDDDDDDDDDFLLF